MSVRYCDLSNMADDLENFINNFSPDFKYSAIVLRGSVRLLRQMAASGKCEPGDEATPNTNCSTEHAPKATLKCDGCGNEYRAIKYSAGAFARCSICNRVLVGFHQSWTVRDWVPAGDLILPIVEPKA